MTKQFLIVVIAVAVLLVGLGVLAPAVATGASKVNQTPGNTVVLDDLDDLILIKADPLNPGK